MQLYTADVMVLYELEIAARDLGGVNLHVADLMEVEAWVENYRLSHYI